MPFHWWFVRAIGQSLRMMDVLSAVSLVVGVIMLFFIVGLVMLMCCDEEPQPNYNNQYNQNRPGYYYPAQPAYPAGSPPPAYPPFRPGPAATNTLPSLPTKSKTTGESGGPPSPVALPKLPFDPSSANLHAAPAEPLAGLDSSAPGSHSARGPFSEAVYPPLHPTTPKSSTKEADSKRVTFSTKAKVHKIAKSEWSPREQRKDRMTHNTERKKHVYRTIKNMGGFLYDKKSKQWYYSPPRPDAQSDDKSYGDDFSAG